MNTTTNESVFFSIDFFEKKIYGTKASFNKAGLGHGPAYEELTAKMSAHPNFSLEVRVQKHHITRAKRTYEGLDFKFMEAYIDTKDNREDLMKDYKSIKETAEKTNLAKYPLTKKWFLGKFSTEENPFDMDAAKKEISDYAIQKAVA